MAKTRHAKGRTKRKSPAKKPRKMMAAKKKPSRKTAKRGAKRTAKPAARRASKRARHAARMATAAPIMIPIKTETPMPARQAAPVARSMPAMPSGHGGDSIMTALVGLLILIAVVSAGIFYPQTKTANQALTVSTPGPMQHR